MVNRKTSKVTPANKAGDKLDPFNNRPISTLVCKQRLNYQENHKIFRIGHSTSQGIVEIADNLRKAIDSSQYSCGVFLDFTKALTL